MIGALWNGGEERYAIFYIGKLLEDKKLYSFRVFSSEFLFE
jgi:hypothetical protein